MDDYISLAQKILTLVTSGMALWKALDAAAAASKDGQKLGFLGGWRSGGDLGLYSISLLVAAIAALSLSSALLTQKELVAWSGAPYILIVVAILSAVACVFPIGIRRDLRHLFWIGLAGLIPSILIVVRGRKTGDSGDSGQVWIPLVVWVFLASALAVYSISKSGYSWTQQKRFLPFGVVLVVVCALAGGVYWSDTLATDERAHSRVKEVIALRQKVDQLSRADQLMLYQLGSEAALSTYYRAEVTKSGGEPPSRGSDQPLNLSEHAQELELAIQQLPEKDAHELFRKRLDGVHPVPKNGEQRVATNIPGNTAKQRFEYFDIELIIKVLSQYQGLQQAYLQAVGGGYPDSVRKQLAPKPLAISVPKVRDLFGRNKSLAELLSVADTETYTPLEAEIFGLPQQISAKLVVNFYRALALNTARNANNKDVAKPVEMYESMPEVQKAAFLNFAASDDAIDLLAHLQLHTSDDVVNQLRTHANLATAQRLDTFRKSDAVTGDPETQKFITDLAALLGTPKRQTTLVKLLSDGTLNPQIPVALVLQKLPLELAGELAKNFTPQEQIIARSIMADPVGEGVNSFLNDSPRPAQVRPVLAELIKMNTANREAVLHNIALDIYGLGGMYALGFFSQTIDQVSQSGVALGIGIATLFCVPAALVVSLLGAGFGKQLLSLSFSTEKLEREPKGVLEEQAQTTTDWEFVGRRNLLGRLQRLSVRSSGTIGLVGRRGIGKTRILRQLLQEYDKLGAVTVWLDCPTSMSQEDFVQSISERVVNIVESRFANFAGIPNNARRRLDRAVMSGSAIAVMFLSLLYGALIASLLPDLAPSLVVPTLVVPSLLVAACGLGLLLIRFSGSAATLRLDRGVSLGSATFEWQQAYDAMARMADRLQSRRVTNSRVRMTDSPISLALAAAPALFLALIVFVVLLYEFPGVSAVIGLTGLCYWGWRSVMSRSRVGDAGLSAVSFTYRFREFVMEISDRIRAGALGKTLAESEIVVVVVVDELDKIVDHEELKAFIRVIKTVFEIRGTRFFLSISQDAYRDLVLGASLGKNEFDSSFDHVELIAPMELDAARSLVKGYLKSLNQPELDDPTIDVIAVLGKGVPRDLLRRCDTAVLLQAEKPASLSDSLLFVERENLLTGLRYLAGLSDRIVKVFTEPVPPLDSILELIANDATNEQFARILAENFVYVHILATRKSEERHELIARYYAFLYSLPTLTTDSIQAALATVNHPGSLRFPSATA
jgi:hypothetical protein